VTTLEAHDAMNAAMQFLSRHGFMNEQRQGFVVGQEQWNVLDMRRGASNARKAKSVKDLPQRVHLEYDRGRITVAASIEPSAAWGGRSSFSTTASDGNPRKMHIHQSLLMNLVTGLEAVLVKSQPVEEASQGLLFTERHALEEARYRSRRNWIVLGVILLFFVGIITLVVVMN
jgi:hypothetical protein